MLFERLYTTRHQPTHILIGSIQMLVKALASSLVLATGLIAGNTLRLKRSGVNASSTADSQCNGESHLWGHHLFG